MAKRYMVGTVDDTPLLEVYFESKNYFVDQQKQVVYADETGLPEVKDEDVISSVLEIANNE
jgi:hypothetical protein